MIIQLKNLFLIIITISSCFVTAQEKENKKAKDSIKSKNSYEELIKKATSIKEGLFTIVQEKEKYYFKVHDSLFDNRDFLVVNKISNVPYQLNEAGLNAGMNFQNQLITFHKDTVLKKVWIKTKKPIEHSKKPNAIHISVKNNFSGSVIEAIDIHSVKDDFTVFGVNNIFNGKEKSIVDVLGNIGVGGAVKSKLSYIDTLKTFHKNIVVKSQLSTSVPEGKISTPITIGVTTNIVLLPKKPMKPRFSSRYVGYFDVKKWFFNDEQHKLKQKEIITRWRLEVKDKDKQKYLKGELVEPKKPIVFYLDPATPTKWKKYIKKGIENWQKAFEKAGFKKAILAKEPTADNKDFDADDVRYSTVTYVASSKANAMGPSVIDPRSGEIIESDVVWWHNVMTSLNSWIRIQNGTLSKEAQKVKISDKLMGEAIEYVSSHEIGHTLGLKHNMGASYAYPVDSLRSKTFIKKVNSTSPSIMDYARYNYVAQPQDGLSIITPSIGPYDIFAIEWAYRWYPNKIEEKLGLSKIINRAKNNPLLFYGEQQSSSNVIDPRSQSEDLGDDAVKASSYGLENLKIIAKNLEKWTYTEKGYYETGKMYMGIIGQWNIYTYHVLNNIGGIYLNKLNHNDNKKNYIPVPYKRQKESVSYLIENVFTIPKWLFFNKTLQKTYPLKDSPVGPFEYSPYTLYRELQYTALYRLFDDKRLLRLLESEIYNPENERRYTAGDLFEDIRNKIFEKTKKRKPLSIIERMTQKNYVDILIVDTQKLFKKTATKRLVESFTTHTCSNEHNATKKHININYTSLKRVSEVTSLKKGELFEIYKIVKKYKKTGNNATKKHYLDIINRIEPIINNK